ncbi:transposase [Celerinatantimonas diazotrophica]|uniref:transposase n=1 Tax=Celerinatantimonas diazotrophica TaxID=412034 RepID=UPI0037BF074F
MDGSIVKTYQDRARSRRKNDENIGKNRGSHSTKIHLAVDSDGLPVYFELSDDQVNDNVHATSLISHAPTPQQVISNKGYDNGSLRNFIDNKGSQYQIPRKQNSSIGNYQMGWY